jgi:hypothetical protein
MSDVIGRTFYFEKSLWSRLDEDAKRCGRSSVKQLEAILKTYYQVGDVELREESLEILGRLMPTSKQTLPLIEADTAGKSKKKRSA